MFSKRPAPDSKIARERRERIFKLMLSGCYTTKQLAKAAKTNESYVTEAIAQIRPNCHIAGWIWVEKAWQAVYMAGVGIDQPRPAQKDYKGLEGRRIAEQRRRQKAELEALGVKVNRLGHVKPGQFIGLKPAPEGEPQTLEPAEPKLPKAMHDLGKPIVIRRKAVPGKSAPRDPMVAALFGGPR